ncbi:MAG: IreB family regulatory phosphoprotein [Eubacteriaceae bacterium]|nr:IreB family regulatory phosphoprotein [Eubacteriaceae bacterium]
MDSKELQETRKFSIAPERNSKVSNSLAQVKKALVEKGYDPINQIVGYLMSGDPTYITSFKDARSIIKKIDRDELLEEVVSFYLKEL